MDQGKGGKEKNIEDMIAEKVESWRKGDREDRGREEVDRVIERVR